MMSVWAWGANTCGQLGLGFASEQVSSPLKLDLDAFRPDSLKEFKRSVNPSNVLISGGGTETCFVFSPCEKGKQSAVICVGLPVHPQTKGSDLQNPAKAVPGFAAKELKHGGTSFCHVSSGWDFHIAIDGEGSVRSWGNNAFGQLGHDSKGTDAPFAIQGLKAVTVAAGLRHSAAVTVDGRLFLWGDNNKGLLGVGSDSKIVDKPKEACLSGSAKQKFVSVKCGKGFTIAFDTNGEFWGCGTNKFDQLGNIKGDLTTYTKLNIGPFESRVKHFECGWNHTLVLLESGDIFSWGRNNFFQLGNCYQVHHVPRKVEGIVEPVTTITCGSEHSLALGASGTLYSWGWNEHDNCGVPSNYSSQASTSVASQTYQPSTLDCVRGPTAVPFSPEAGKVVSIGCGYGFNSDGHGVNVCAAYVYSCEDRDKSSLEIYNWWGYARRGSSKRPTRKRIAPFDCSWPAYPIGPPKSGFGDKKFSSGKFLKKIEGSPLWVEIVAQILMSPILDFSAQVRCRYARRGSSKRPRRKRIAPLDCSWPAYPIGPPKSGFGDNKFLSGKFLKKIEGSPLWVEIVAQILMSPILDFSAQTSYQYITFRVKPGQRWNMPRIFNLQGMVDEAMQNRLSRIGCEVCPAHVIRVWQAVSCFIEEQFRAGKGVRIPNLLKITYRVQRSKISQQNVIVNRTPVLLLAEDVAKKYFITVKKPTFNLSLPEVPLNLSKIALATCLPRSVVEICIQEVIQAFHRALVMDHNVQFHLHGIGRLIIENRYCHATFCSCFMEKFEFERPRNKPEACAF